MITIYTYKLCGTCKKAIAFLKEHGIQYTERAIRDTPPSLKELNQVSKFYDDHYPVLFNRSGKDYRENNLKSTLPNMGHDQRLSLLHSNGNLIKRPFVVSDSIQLVGFDEAIWRQAFRL